MAKVYPVDQDVIDRTARWLLSQQQPNGAWLEQGYSEHWRVDAELPSTAYITWALIEAGYRDAPEVDRAIAYIREFARAGRGCLWPGPDRQCSDRLRCLRRQARRRTVLEKLYNMRVEEGETVYWENSQASFMGATGVSGSVETTALAAAAFMRAAVYPDAVNGALASLVQSKDSWGTWSTTQATILSLKTLLLATQSTGALDEAGHRRGQPEQGADPGNRHRSGPGRPGPTPATFDAGLLPHRGQPGPDRRGRAAANLMYQVATSYYLPWDQVAAGRCKPKSCSTSTSGTTGPAWPSTTRLPSTWASG